MKRIFFCIALLQSLFSCAQKHVNETSVSTTTSLSITTTAAKEDIGVDAIESDSKQAPLTKLGEYDVFVRVSASPEGEGVVSIFQKPDTGSKVVGELYMVFSSVFHGKLLEYGDDWCRIETEEATGYVQTKDVIFSSMVIPDEELFLIAVNPFKLHTVCHSDGEDWDFYYHIPVGTIICSCDEVLDAKTAEEIYMGDVFEKKKNYIIQGLSYEDIMKKSDVKIVERKNILNNH